MDTVETPGVAGANYAKDGVDDWDKSASLWVGATPRRSNSSLGAASDTGRQSKYSEYSDLCWSFTSPSLAFSFGDVVSSPRRFLAVGFRRHHHVWCALGNAFRFYRGTNDAAC
jgi:hypothetical protein